MATASSVLDDLIKEYLLFRGFTSTLKSFENDIKADKDKSYKVNRIMDQLLAYVATYDISSLREYWEHLDKRFFKRLDHQHYNNVRKLETCLLRLYVVHALQNSKQDKVTEFFERYVTELQPQTDWREWFAIPFIKNPEQNTTFEMYFQKSWQETFYLSLHNFLITVFYHLPMPTLLHYDKERGFQQKLEEQVTKLKQQVVDLADQITDLQRKNSRLTTELDERKYQTGETVVEEEDEEFYVIQKPKSVFSQITKVFPKKPKEKIKKNIKIQRQTDVNNQGKIIQQKQQVVKQQELEIPQEAQDQERPLSDIEEEHKTSRPISNPITTEEHKNICKTYSHEPLAKSLSFDSGVKVYSKDDTDSALTRTCTMPSNTSLGSTLPRDSKQDDLLQPKIVRFDADNDQQRPFIHLGQEEYKEHHSGVVHCRFSSSGRVIASSDSDGIVKVWTNHPDIRTCATLMSKSPLLSLEWASKPERLLLLGTGHGKVRFYDTDNKKTICDVSTDSLYPRIVSLSCSPTGTAFVCSAATSKKPASQMSSSLRLGSNVKGRPGDVMSSSSNGKSSSDGVLQCWDMKNMKVERNLPVDPTPVCINCTAYNHNGTLLVSGGADGMIRLFDMRSYDCLMGMHAHDGEVCCVQFSVDETTIYSMGLDGKFIQWSVHRMGQKIADLNIHEGAVLKSSLRPNQSRGINGGGSYGRLFAFDSEGQHVLTCGPQSGLIYKVDGKNLSQVLSLPYHRQHVMSVDWTSSLSCSTCLTGSLDGSIQITSLLKQ